MIKSLIRTVIYVQLLILAGGLGMLLSRHSESGVTSDPAIHLRQQNATVTPNETIPPYTPLPSLTPSQTLKPPPTFEPPTATPLPTDIPTPTPTPTSDVSVSIPGLRGAESPTPSSTPGCEPREDWQLTYQVQRDDALATIAEKYNTTMFDLAAGNCLEDMNLIVVGQILRVPGDAPPAQSSVECTSYEVLTPINGAVTIPGDGNLTLNWRGPLALRNLIRIYRPDGSVFERLIELRQNETINMSEELQQGGTYTWYVYPLDDNYQQINCPEGGPWFFTKEESQSRQ